MVFPFPRHGRRQVGERDVATLCNYVGAAYLDLTALTKKDFVCMCAYAYVCACACTCVYMCVCTLFSICYGFFYVNKLHFRYTIASMRKISICFHIKMYVKVFHCRSQTICAKMLNSFHFNFLNIYLFELFLSFKKGKLSLFQN